MEIYGKGQYIRYNNPIQEMLKKAEGEMDEQARKKIYADLQKLIADDFVNVYYLSTRRSRR